MLRNTARSFGSLTKFFHWLIAFIICIQYYLVWSQNFIYESSPIKAQYILLHKSFGITVFILGFLFLFWKLINQKPDAVAFQPRWKHIVAKITHHSLLTLILLMPILGYLMSSADGRTVNFFELINIPNLITENQYAANFYFQAHKILGYLLFILISFHIMAALHHHFILKDGVLKKMLPFVNKNK